MKLSGYTFQVICALALFASAAGANQVPPGGSVVTTVTARVQSEPSSRAPRGGTQPAGSLGIIKEGPIVADGVQWWRVDYGSGMEGWTDGRQFVETYFPPPEAMGAWRSLVARNETPSETEQGLIRQKAGLDWNKLKLARDYSEAVGRGSAVLVIRNGWIAGEWGSTKEINVASVTKSLTALALAKLFDLSRAGLLPRPVEPESLVYEYLPREFGDSDPLKRRIRVKHFMSMSSGIQPADSKAFSLSAQEAFTYPMSAAPGELWSYASLPVNFLSVVVEKASGQSLQDFFMEHIGGPIGAPVASWESWEGYTAGGAGARISARNLARIGYLALQRGRWHDGTAPKQVVSSESMSFITSWPAFLDSAALFESVEPHFAPDPESHQYYGSLFWTNRQNKSLGPTVPADAYYMHGFRDNLCVVIPSLNMVVVRLASSGPGMDPAFHSEFIRRVVDAVVELDDRPDPEAAPFASLTPVGGEPSNDGVGIETELGGAPVASGTLQEFREAVTGSLARHGAAMGAYLEREVRGVALGVAKFFLLAFGFLWIRRRVRGRSAGVSDAPEETRVLENPFAFAVLLSLAGALWIFPHAPRFLWTLLGSLALLSSVNILRQRIRTEFTPFLYVLLVLLSLDALRELGAGVHFWPRVLFLAKMGAAIAFCGWMLRSRSGSTGMASDRAEFARTTTLAACAGLALSAFALVSEVTGHESLARLFGDTLLTSAYLAVLLYASVELLDGLFGFMVAVSLRETSDGWIRRFATRDRLRHGVWSTGVLVCLAVMLKWIWLPFLTAL